jgi:hypothetical protein
MNKNSLHWLWRKLTTPRSGDDGEARQEYMTKVTLVDKGVVGHFNRTVQAARLKGARAIITGVSDVAAVSIIESGVDWSDLATLGDLQTGLMVGLSTLGFKIEETVN